MIVRKAAAADIPFLMKLERETATAAHWPEHQYQSLFVPGGPRITLVLEEGHILAGFLIALRVVDEWEMENIVVAAQERRRGFASELMHSFLEIARKASAGSVFLEVRESNQPARGFYEKFGFRESGRRPGYYRNPDEDAINYRLTL